MGYDATISGHRIKDPFSQVSWVHSVRRRCRTSTLKQCLFDEHLLADASSMARTVAIVESEKTALVAALFIRFGMARYRECTAVSIARAMQVLKEREVLLFLTSRQRMSGSVRPRCYSPFVNLPLAPDYWKRWLLMNNVPRDWTLPTSS
ncbi:MAG: DUF6371 domain-containing protein [Alistipes indistinctus]